MNIRITGVKDIVGKALFAMLNNIKDRDDKSFEITFNILNVISKLIHQCLRGSAVKPILSFILQV